MGKPFVEVTEHGVRVVTDDGEDTFIPANFITGVSKTRTRITVYGVLDDLMLTVSADVFPSLHHQVMTLLKRRTRAW